jgi:putative DNA primase/helicase
MNDGIDNVVGLAAEQAKRGKRLGEDALALLFVAAHGENLRYVAAWSRWMRWTGTHWRHDDTLAVFNLIRDTCREALGEKAKRLDSRTVAGVERLARSDRRVAATVEQWDRDLWLLNTPGGAVDLRTGTLSPHRREDYSTKLTAVAPGGDCPLWIAFLRRITNDDTELQLFLQRMAGYALTGSIQEHALFFGHGTGANGKSVFVGTWKTWAERAGEDPGSQKAFSQNLLDRGFAQRRQSGTRRMGFDGIGLKPRYSDEEDRR